QIIRQDPLHRIKRGSDDRSLASLPPNFRSIRKVIISLYSTSKYAKAPRSTTTTIYFIFPKCLIAYQRGIEKNIRDKRQPRDVLIISIVHELKNNTSPKNFAEKVLLK